MPPQQNQPSDSSLSKQSPRDDAAILQSAQDPADIRQPASAVPAPAAPAPPGNLADNSGVQPAATAEVSLPAEAEDSDLIEREWVDRAKQIVEHTREDPYEQQRALSQMKADYLKKRYNKDIKISEG